MKESEVQREVKSGVLKEGFVYKRSKYLKEWRQRWVVLTARFCFAFKDKQVYKDPTQVIRLADTLVLKSYFGKSEERACSFALKTSNAVYLFSGTFQERLAWITQLQKAIHSSFALPSQPSDQQLMRQRAPSVSMRISQINNIEKETKETLKELASNPALIAQFRSTLGGGSSADFEMPIEVQGFKSKEVEVPVFAKSRQQVSQGRTEAQWLPEVPVVPVVPAVGPSPPSAPPSIAPPTTSTPALQRPAQRERAMIEQLKSAQSSLQSHKFRQTMTQRSECSKAQLQLIVAVFQVIDKLQEEGVARLLVDLVCQLNVTYKQALRKQILFVTLMHEKSRFFTELLLQSLNRETDPERIFNDLLMVECLASHQTEVFHRADLEVLLNVIVRELESYRAETHQYACLKVFDSIIRAEQYASVRKYRAQQFRGIMKQMGERDDETGALARRVLGLYK